MLPLDLLQHILKQGPDRNSSHQLLGQMGEDPIQLSSVAEESSRSKSSIYRFVDPLIERGLILEEDSHYQLTCAGAVLYREIRQHDETLTRESEYDENPLSYIFGAEIRMSILQQLRAGTELKTNLIDECSSSRSTVRRTLDQFEEYGWVNQRGGHCEALDESERAIAAYSDLLEIAQKVLDNISLLRRMGPEYADIPIEALGEAEHFVNSDSDREQLTKVTCSLADLNVERIRGTVTVHTQMSADAFQDYFTGDTEIEIIIGTGVHREILRSQNILDFKDAIGSGKTKFSMRVHSEVESVGFGIFGTDLIIMGADKGHVHPAGIVCTDDRLIEWAEERFDRLQKESSPMLEHFRKTASNIPTRANEIVHSLLDK